MTMNNTILVSTGAGGATTWTLPSAGFSNPMYITSPALGTTDATGFDIIGAGTVVVAFQGTYSGQTVLHQQTLDPLGVDGWFAVEGSATDDSSASTGGSTSGKAYAFPAIGNRHRIQVSALASGAMVARIVSAQETNAIIGTPTSGGNVPVVAGNRAPKGYQQIVGLISATTLTVPAGANVAVIRTEGAAVRWRDDGTNPTASVGMELMIGEALMYDGSLSAIAFIQETATATLDVSYYG